MKDIIKYLEKMAKHECGCAPSAGYFEELILGAREALQKAKEYEKK